MHISLLALASLVAVVAPTSLVDTFVGSSGTPAGGPIDTFPGADLPFGMVQWSPDTPSQNAGGGYEYSDKQITGLSLTHLSGPGLRLWRFRHLTDCRNAAVVAGHRICDVLARKRTERARMVRSLAGWSPRFAPSLR